MINSINKLARAAVVAATLGMVSTVASAQTIAITGGKIYPDDWK